METICINCPFGCSLHIEEIDGVVRVTGNSCKRGETYGVDEFIHPLRTLTTLIKVENGTVASCKTSKPIPKELILSAAKSLSKITVKSNIEIGDVILNNFLNLGVDIIITGKTF